MTIINVWTGEMIVAFRKLHGDKANYSFTEIAAKMSAAFDIQLSRNACIGKARRLGFPMRDATPRQQVEKRKIKVKVDAPIPVKLPRRLRSSGEDAFNLTIYETREGDCKWPMGKMEDYPPYTYCGHPTPIGCPYCATHSKMAYNTPRIQWT